MHHFWFIEYGFEIPALRWYIVHVWGSKSNCDKIHSLSFSKWYSSSTCLPYEELVYHFSGGAGSALLPCLSTRVAHSVVWSISSVVFLRCCCVVWVLCIWNIETASDSAFVLIVYFFEALWKYWYLSRKECLVLLRSTSVTLCDYHCFEPLWLHATLCGLV